MGRPSREAAEVLISYLNIPMTVEEYLKVSSEEYAAIFKTGEVPLMPGVDKLIRHLHAKGVPIAIGTSSKRETFLLKTQKHQEFLSLFHHILCAPEEPKVTKGKPDPATFLVCAERFEPPPATMQQVLVFEDAPAGVKAANAANMTSVWVADARFPIDPKDVEQPFLTLQSLEEFRPEDFGLPPYEN